MIFLISALQILHRSLRSVAETEGAVGVLTEVVFPDEISTQEFYQLLQNKTKVYVDLSINETNSYGDRSFSLIMAKTG